MANERGAGLVNLDPDDWGDFRRLAHRALEEMIDHIESLRERPVWVAPPDSVRAAFSEDLPKAERSFESVLRDFEHGFIVNRIA